MTEASPTANVRPLRVLHRGGNAREAMAHAGRPEVDAIEADVWVRAGIVVAHHGRPLGPLPFTLDVRGITPGPRAPVRLDELLDTVDGGTEVVLDLRSWFGDPAPDLARALLRLASRERLRLTCESWAIAARLRAWVPDMPVALSVRTEAQLRRYFVERQTGDLEMTGVAVRHSLLHSKLEAQSLRRRAGWVSAWTVDEVARARELASWGVDALVSNRIEVLSAL